MQWQDSIDRLGLVTRLLHWLMAALLVWQLIGMALKLGLGRHPVVAVFVQLHQPIGLLLLTLAVLRLIWALVNRRRRPRHGNGVAARLRSLGQGALYVLLLLVPVLGLLRASTRSAGPQADEVGSLAQMIGTVHGPLAWMLLVLIVGHVGVALLHALIWRDGATDAMFGRLRG